MKTTRVLAVLLALFVTLGVLARVIATDTGTAAPQPTVTVTVTPSPTHTPAEDDPDFDCTIHGNRVCAPGTQHTEREVAMPDSWPCGPEGKWTCWN